MTQGDVIRAEAKDIPRIFQVHFTLFIFDIFHEFYELSTLKGCVEKSDSTLDISYVIGSFSWSFFLRLT